MYIKIDIHLLTALSLFFTSDINEEINKRITLMQNGLVSKLENRMWYFGETEAQAREALMKIDEETQHEQETDMMMQYEMMSRNAKVKGNQ